MDALEHVAAVQAERDGNHLIRALRRDNRDRSVGGRTSRRGRNQQQCDGENEESTHATDTAEAGPEVPVSYGFPIRGVAQLG